MGKDKIYVDAQDYAELCETQGRVNAAFILLEMNEYADRDIIKSILVGHVIKKKSGVDDGTGKQNAD